MNHLPRRTTAIVGLALAACIPTFAQAAHVPATLAIDGGAVAIPTAGPDGMITFKGIPYAAPPVGPLRWRPSAPLPTWNGVRSATQFGPDCMQAPSETSSPAARPRSEDCLYLNIWTTALTGAKRPVYLWIHGGGSRVGSGAQPEFDGTALARQGIVVVTINYRLGALGFLSTSGLSAESGHGASGNYGLMDDIAALQWVQRNIALFGGDRARVTIGGESSGSVSTGALMASPLARGLFRQVIGESGSVFRLAGFGSMGATSLAAEETKGDALAHSLGAETPDKLRAIPATAILAAADKSGGYFNLPVVDGYVLPDAPLRLFASHRFNDVPLLLGWNAQEGSLQTAGPLGTLPQLLDRYYGPGAKPLAHFYVSSKSDDLQAEITAAGDNAIAYPTWKWGMAQQRFGRQPLFVYQFDRAPPIPQGNFGPRFDVGIAGAYHGAEISYAFDTLGSRPTWAVTRDDHLIAQTMSRYWANFIKTGNPNGAGLPSWPRYEPSKTPRRMAIGLDIRATNDSDYSRFAAIDAAHTQNDPPLPGPPDRSGGSPR